MFSQSGSAKDSGYGVSGVRGDGAGVLFVEEGDLRDSGRRVIVLALLSVGPSDSAALSAGSVELSGSQKTINSGVRLG